MDKILSSGVQELQEIFAVPTKVEKIKGFSDIDLYTSDKLKSNYILSMFKTERTKSIVGEIKRLVEKGLIVPCFLTKNILQFAAHRIFSRSESKSVLGFYIPSQKKLFLLIDNNINLFGFASNDWLANLTIHEGMHMFADLKPSKFLSVFKNDLIQFYNNLFTELLNLENQNSKSIESIVLFIAKMEKDLPRSNDTLKKYFDQIEKLQEYSTLEHNTFENIVRDYIVSIKLFWTDFGTFRNIAKSYKHILTPIYNSYYKTFDIHPNTFAIQELFSISEVISVAAEEKTKISNKILSGFKMLI